MKIESVRIENFRSFEDATVPVNDYTCLVGPNGTGKSTVLMALNVFFQESDNVQTNVSKLDEEDFHCRNTEDPVRITVTFSDLSDEAKKDLGNYVRQGKLIVSAVAKYDKSIGKADVKQYGQRLGLDAFRKFFEAADDRKSVAELKAIYEELRATYSELPKPGTKNAMTDALHDYETACPDECDLIPSEDEFYGFSKGANRIAKHVQWVYVPAVKDATSEQVDARNSALGKLLARTVELRTDFDAKISGLHTDMQERYQELLDDNQNVLEELSNALQGRIAEWAHPNASMRLQWKQDPDKSVRVEIPSAHILAGEGQFEGELARFGHGLQRSYLLALLQELAGADDADGPTLILACEEPELYQHPPQARHLASVLDTLSKGNSQVIVSTHDPHFITGQGFEDVRMIRKDSSDQKSVVSYSSFNDISKAIATARGESPVKPAGMLARVHQALQPSLNEMFFTGRLVLVEGLEDVAYILTYISLMEREDEFRSLGCHLVPVNGKSELLQPLLIARKLKIPAYVVFDGDADKQGEEGDWHKKDNRALLNVLGKETEDPMPVNTLTDLGFTMWHSNIGAIVESEIGKDEWQNYRLKADTYYGQVGKLHKNSLHIGASLTFAWNDEKRASSLESVCNAILKPSNYLIASN